MGDWTIADLEDWDARIRAKVEAFGLHPYPQDFEISDAEEMLGYMAYSGIPSHYGHWSYGKAFEKLRTLYAHGVSGLPYEMVINANPSIAYLMRDNSLCLQILTIAHVYGHSDFFRENFYFRATDATNALSSFRAAARRVRGYVEDPSIGADRVEPFLDAAHGLSLHINRNPSVPRLRPGEERERLLRDAVAPPDPWASLHQPHPVVMPDLQRNPPSPVDDLLLFVRDNNPYLSEWERDLLTVVDAQARYFQPQIDTKIMNEGWASFWHREILRALELPPGLHLEFLVHHNQVVRPHPGGLNPYHLGLEIWDTLDARCVGDRSLLFEVRRAERDVSFLRRFLDADLMRKLDLFEVDQRGEQRVASKVSSEDDWEAVKATLLQNVGSATIPVIRVVDADHGGSRTLLLHHDHDGRELHLEYAEHTLAHAYRLWGRPVLLATRLGNKEMLLRRDAEGFSAAPA